jgi:ABC-type amino acid transport substrate-binding protein/cytochrome c2
VVAVAVLLAATAGADAEVRRIRLCADPSNLPFSAQQAGQPGFELEIAQAVANTLGAELSVHWVVTAREVVVLRQLDEGRCDVFMGLPLTPAFRADKPRLTFTVPYYVMRQVVVSPVVGGVRSLEELSGKLVGVQAMTLGDQLVYERGLNRRIHRTAEELFEALTRGEVDAALIDSALGGWFITRTPGFRAVEIRDPRRELPIGAALRKADTQLTGQIDDAIGRLQGTVLAEILARYGIAQAPPATPPAPAPSSAPPPAAAVSPELRVGRSTYLTQCSQCHGIDAKGTPAAANLQAFKGSEDDFLKVVRNGRPGTAMTPWKGIVSDDDIRAIARYVKQLSTEPRP